MLAWSRSLEGIIRSEAARLVADHGDEAAEVARREARMARDKRKHHIARQYALVATYITENGKSAPRRDD